MEVARRLRTPFRGQKGDLSAAGCKTHIAVPVMQTSYGEPAPRAYYDTRAILRDIRARKSGLHMARDVSAR